MEWAEQLFLRGEGKKATIMKRRGKKNMYKYIRKIISTEQLWNSFLHPSFHIQHKYLKRNIFI